MRGTNCYRHSSSSSITHGAFFIVKEPLRGSIARLGGGHHFVWHTGIREKENEAPSKRLNVTESSSHKQMVSLLAAS